MKNLGSKLLWCALILWFAWGIIDTFGGMDNVALIGNGSLAVGILKLPFCLLGGVQLIRGFWAVIGKDAEKMDESGHNSYPLFVLYFAATIVGIMFFIEICSGCFYTKSDLQDARNEAYDAGYWQGMEDSSAFYKESDLELSYEEGYAEGKKDAKAEYKNSADSIDKVLRSAESFAVQEIGTGFLFEASRKDIQEYLEDTLPDQTGLSAYDKAVGDYNKTTNVKNSILRRMLMITYYCEYLSEYK